MKTFFELKEELLNEAANLTDEWIKKAIHYIVGGDKLDGKLEIERSGPYVSVYYTGNVFTDDAMTNLDKIGLVAKRDDRGWFVKKGKMTIDISDRRISISDITKFVPNFKKAKAVGAPPKA